MILRPLAIGLVAAFAALAGCAEDEADSPASEEPSATIESSLAQKPPRLLGMLRDGESRNGYYYVPGQLRAWGFTARPGDSITIDVRSRFGDAVAYLTDNNYRIIRYNDNALPGSTDSRIVYKVPATSPVTSYRIVFANFRPAPAPFDVTLDIQALGSVAGTCSYAGRTFQVGDQFEAQDGCNQCTCTSAGIDCTKSICACNPENEPDKIYLHTPEECIRVTVVCGAGYEQFENECGCGCKLRD